MTWTRPKRIVVAAAALCALAAMLLWLVNADIPDVPELAPARRGAQVSGAARPGRDEASRPERGASLAGPATPALSGRTPPSGAPAAEPGAPGDATSSAPLDVAELRRRVRWGVPGLCGPEAGARVAPRSALLARFMPTPGTASPILHDPAVGPEVLAEVQRSLDLAGERVLVRGLAPLPPPVVYVYRDVEQLRSVSCANRAAIGYFDGAIHVSGDPAHGPEYVRETILHEYVHHLLLGRGIRLPTWLQEGLAMSVAGETWWRDPSLGLVDWARDDPLPFQDLVAAFPATADEEYALAAYAQSALMLEFLRSRAGDERVVTLVQALAWNAVDADEAFSWAAGLSGQELERAWTQYLGGSRPPGDPHLRGRPPRLPWSELRRP